MSRRQELLEYAETGRLRQANERLSEDAQDLLVDIVIRYCEPRRPKRGKVLRSDDTPPPSRMGT